MFLNELYTIQSQKQEDNVITIQVSLNPNHCIFEGHFPGMPILPGVVQLQIVKELFADHLKKSVRTREMKTCKFLKVINPTETQSLGFELKLSPVTEFVDVVATIKDEENTYLKTQITFDINTNY